MIRQEKQNPTYFPLSSTSAIKCFITGTWYNVPTKSMAILSMMMTKKEIILNLMRTSRDAFFSFSHFSVVVHFA